MVRHRPLIRLMFLQGDDANAGTRAAPVKTKTARIRSLQLNSTKYWYNDQQSRSLAESPNRICWMAVKT